MKKKLIMNALASASLLLTTVVGTAAAAAPVAPTASKPVLAPVNADPALWVVKDADTTIYLFGTVHILKDNIKWFDGGVKAAYDASSEIVFELDLTDTQALQKTMLKLAIDPDGPALSKKLDPETAAKLTKTLTDIGLPAAAFEPFEPWVLPVVISGAVLAKTGYTPESGVETQLTNALKKDGKKLGALETAEEQMGFFDTLPEAAQIAYLKSSLEDLPNMDMAFGEMVSAWSKGDPDTLAALLNKAMAATPELETVLLNNRNARWAQWIENRLATPGTIFIAVGAGHLAGENSVQEKLKARKLTATRIPS